MTHIPGKLRDWNCLNTGEQSTIRIEYGRYADLLLQTRSLYSGIKVSKPLARHMLIDCWQ